MADLDTLLKVAHAEWRHWGRSTWHLATGRKRIGATDDDPDFSQYVLDRYCAVVDDTPSLTDISDDEYYWSAVGMSFVFNGAGFRKTEFPFSDSHSTWIRAFVKARRKGAAALYHGYRLDEEEAVPEVGDLIGYTYAKVSFEKAQGFFDRTDRYPSHTDLVIAVRPGEIDVVGFNVEDSVTRKTVAMTSDGHVADRTKKWFVVLRRRGF